MPERTTQRSLNDRLMAEAIDIAKAGRAGVDWLDGRVTELELRVAALETRAHESSNPSKGTVEVKSPGGWRTRAPAWAGVAISVAVTAAVAIWQLL